MATELEYTQFALRVYDASVNNKIGMPTGWSQIDWLPDQGSGFSAGVYKKDTTNEIVIAYAGANDLMDVLNWSATAFPATQVFAAMSYYLAFKNAYPTADISFTGHSLGGGLASLMAVFFDKRATVFDEMPSQIAALNPSVYLTAAASMALAGFSDENFDSYVASCGLAALSRESNVDHYYVDGEALGAVRNSYNTLVGSVDEPISLGNSTAGEWDRHSMALLTALKISPSFHDAARRLPDLVTQLLDVDNLFAAASSEQKEDLLLKLLRNQLGVSGTIAPNGMLERFAADMQKIAQPGGLTMANSALAKTLTAFAMQMYYEDPKSNATNPQKKLFDYENIVRGIHFYRTDVAATLANAEGYNHYFDDYLDTWKPEEKAAVLDELPGLEDWYVQAGDWRLIATAGSERAFMIGGNGNDDLTGGTADDVLYGGRGMDLLVGGTGDDLLLGGEDHDVYTFQAADGNDIIIDDDMRGAIKYGGSFLRGGKGEKGSDVYKDDKGNSYLWDGDDGSTLVINGKITLKNFSNGKFGIVLTRDVDDEKNRFDQTSQVTSPIILDLDRDGVETVNLRSNTYFDADGNGFAEQTGWASPDDGLLVLDRNGDGIINNGGELFGSETRLNNGTKAANGFQALDELDVNRDGKIDAADAAYGQLRIWRDTDGDGYSRPDELKTLSEAGVFSINTGYARSNYIDANDNEHKQVGSFTKTDGTTGTATDVWFKTDKAYTVTKTH